MGQVNGADSEVGQLRTVLMHRPGPELQRLTPRHRERVLLRTLPWLSRARQEHDELSQLLRDEGVEVLYLTELLQDALEYQAARDEAIWLAIGDAGLGDELRDQLRSHLEDMAPEVLAQVLVAGVSPQELKAGHGVVFELLDRHDFVLDPLPNLVFTRDSSLFIGDHIAVASLATRRRRRESGLAGVIYRHHPRFAGTKWLYRHDLEQLDGGDVLLLSPGVVAIGVGERTTPAGAERLARNVFDAGLAHTVLAVPMVQHGDIGGHLDTACTVIDVDSVIMHPAVAYSLTAHAITPRESGLRISRRQPFLEAAARAMGIERLHVIDTGIDAADSGDPWDDDGNVLAIGRRIAVSHERNVRANSRLEDAGVRVIRVPSSELGSLRGGPRCMACAVSREPSALADAVFPVAPRDSARPLYRESISLAATEAPTGAMPTWRDAPVPAAAAASGPAGQRNEELASASLGSRRCHLRRAACLRTRPTPKSRPKARMTSATMANRKRKCRMAPTIMTTRMTAAIAAPSSRMRRSMVLRYGGRIEFVSTGVHRSHHIGLYAWPKWMRTVHQKGHLAEIVADQVVCATWS
jgi:arginine deiminase